MLSSRGLIFLKENKTLTEDGGFLVPDYLVIWVFRIRLLEILDIRIFDLTMRDFDAPANNN